MSDTAIDFKHIVGNFTWPFLTKFDFYRVKTSEDDLINLCSRHAAVKTFFLSIVELTKGTWASTFTKIGRIMPSADAILEGYFSELETGNGFDVCWDPSKLKHPEALLPQAQR